MVVLDLMIPDVDGLTVCRSIREGSLNRSVPTLILTAKREESDKVLGLEIGADDYLTKLFGVREFVARVRAIVRRSRDVALPHTGQRLVVHGVEIDVEKHRLRISEKEIKLTSKEFQLLYLLASHPGILFSRESLLARI